VIKKLSTLLVSYTACGQRLKICDEKKLPIYVFLMQLQWMSQTVSVVLLCVISAMLGVF